MTRVEKDTYSVLIRGDYLYGLGRLASDKEERDRLIATAVEQFLGDSSAEARELEIDEEGPNLRVFHPVGKKPDFYMYFQIISFPDYLYNAIRRQVPYSDEGTVVNAAIRVYLENRNLWPIPETQAV